MTDRELEQLIAMMAPDAEGRVPISAFKALECWEVPLPGSSSSSGPPRKRTEDAAGSSSG